MTQLYVSYPPLGLTTPQLQLRGFTKSRGLAPGESRDVSIPLDKYAFAFWDERGHHWRVAPGKYKVFAGTSSDDLVLEGEVAIEKGFLWGGL